MPGGIYSLISNSTRAHNLFFFTTSFIVAIPIFTGTAALRTEHHKGRDEDRHEEYEADDYTNLKVLTTIVISGGDSLLDSGKSSHGIVENAVGDHLQSHI